MARVFSKQAATFNHPKDYETTASVEALVFAEVPDWVMDSGMFKLLEKSKKIEVIVSRADIAKVEKSNGKDIMKSLGETSDEVVVPGADLKEDKVETEDEEAETEAEVEVEEYEKMTAKQLYKLCTKKGLEVEAQQNKDYYLEKLLA